ncbi:T9SS type A sorting domain-containing protein [Polaribacter aestuariivivens]|uniref:T9SS type A sorting domain-containing protein n=1 Tax=Polaribacter aestuariivivens TaxID=2304626 RepID=A0A5S3N5G2_9FLAO|nr:LamG-like jellyroll fold domain-containing protein [Polaribacter aestuariivivens]TMM30618.1 T9SS type A sorting domain-containing protein [Polaribacter aestuariivivens]
MMRKILLLMVFTFSFHFVNAQTINDANILMYLDFEGDLVDAKGNFTFAQQTTGSATTPISYSSTEGKFGQYGVFNNSSYESSGNTVYNTSNDVSIALWVRIDNSENLAASQITTIFDMNNGAAAGTADDGQPQLRFRSNSSSLANEFVTSIPGSEIYSNTRVNKERWYHVAVVHDVTAKSWSYYINGVLDTQQTYTTSPRNAQEALVLGTQKAGQTGQAILGDMDDFLITSELLSAEQIKTIMDFGVEAARSTTATTKTWLGTTSDWDTASNWSPSGVPSGSNDVIIDDGTANDPVASGAISANNIIVQENASLTVNGTFTANNVSVYDGASLIAKSTITISGNFTYNTITTDPTGAPLEWHLLSSPVSGETYDNDWIEINYIGTGTAANRAISLYDNTTDADGDWTYFQAGSPAETFNSGEGFSTRKVSYESAKDEEIYAFIGSFPDADVTTTINQSANNWNLSGNPFPSYIRVSELVANNTSSLSGAFQTVYVWDSSLDSGNGLYTSLAGTDYIAPGQGFFVNAANSTAGNFVFAESLQSHQTGVTFYKSNAPKISLSIFDGNKTRQTEVSYNSNNKLGLDPGNDIGLFTGISSNFSVYTEILEDNTGISFERQALPDSNYESMIVPVGVIADAGKEITFKADVQNLPSGIQVYLEDRVAKTYTLLDTSSNHTVVLDTKQNGTGRFYMHTSASSVLSTDNVLLNSISIYKTLNSTVRIAGLEEGKTTFQLYNVLGKQIVNTTFNANGTKDISLPDLTAGIYLVKLQTETGSLSKKIILE